MPLLAAVEAYFKELRRVVASGAATGERSGYVPLANLLNAIGATLKPKVFCVVELSNQGAGHPDIGLYTTRQMQAGRVRDGQLPEGGVVEAKAVVEDAWVTAASDQVSRYWGHYGLVLVTNFRDFVLVGEDAQGCTSKLETLRLAAGAEDFERQLEHPRAFAERIETALVEYLKRALTHRAVIAQPRDLAKVLASYARDGLARVEAADDASSLAAVRTALEEALGVRFDGEKGIRFFHSTLIQTLFYGVFSAWVLWSRAPVAETKVTAANFSWREAVWHLRAPVLRALFQQISDPGRLQPLGLVEVLDWTAAALDRVDRAAFFARFDEGEAVPYFYEPFLQAFDPVLRKQLGVWYTPTEVVRYMVARVDLALKDDFGIPDGLAAENVYVLDPCCGTGAYLAEVLRRIAVQLERRGSGALTGARVKQAAIERVFGFEIMPAPFVVAHLQVGLTMQALNAPLADDGAERAGIFLTNALIGWEPKASKSLPFPELEDERDRAEQVKQDTPILVILGNPPYNGFAGVSVGGEERELSKAYRTTKRVRRPEGRGLNDLYVRFFRMAERRIAEKTGQGIVCFISNYSWLEGLSFTGMRERYLEAFDVVRIDNLNGDKYKTGKIAPDGSSDPSIFSTEGDPVGIQVGTAIATLVRKTKHRPAEAVAVRHLWGQTKPRTLLETAEAKPAALYEDLSPSLSLGLPFVQTTVSEDWFSWPSLPELFPAYFPGVKTSRDGFLVDTDHDRLKIRISDYFDSALSQEEIARRYPAAVKTTGAFDGRTVRDSLLTRGGPNEDSFVRFSYRPFDDRWLYWEADGGLLDRPRATYGSQVPGNLWLSAAKHLRKDVTEPQACCTEHMASLHLIERGAFMFPAWLRGSGVESDESHTSLQPNLSSAALRYLEHLDLNVEDLFYHVLVMLHDPIYLEANADALRMDWPRIPIPGWPKGGGTYAAEALAASAARGRELAHLLDPNKPVPGVTEGVLRPELAIIALPDTIEGGNMAADDFAVTASWGRRDASEAIMPGSGRRNERAYTTGERRTPILLSLGETTFDIYLNARAYWRNVPAKVWNYKLGGYQVLKKWLSYRERNILGRPLKPAEVQQFADTARRIAAILLLTIACPAHKER